MALIALGQNNFAVTVTNAPRVTSMIRAARISLTDTYLSAWMKSELVPYFQEQIVNRWGGSIGKAAWPPLTAATKKIRHQMGVMDDGEINIRSGDMFDHLLTNSEVTPIAGAVQMAIPGNQGDWVMEQKIRTAQHGKPPSTFGKTHTGPTPPRPVLTVNAADMAAVMTMLQLHIMQMVASRGTTVSGFSSSGAGGP